MAQQESDVVATIVHASTYEELKKDIIPESRYEIATIYSFMLSLSEDWGAAVAVRLNHVGQQESGKVAVTLALLNPELKNGLVTSAEFKGGYCTEPSGITVGGDSTLEAYLASYTDLSGYSPFTASTAVPNKTAILTGV